MPNIQPCPACGKDYDANKITPPQVPIECNCACCYPQNEPSCYETEHGTIYTGPPADTWQTSLFGGPCAENVAEQRELFGAWEYNAKPKAKGPRIQDLAGQLVLFGDSH